jgi:hypothetical protein
MVQPKEPDAATQDASTPTEKRRGRQKPEGRQKNSEPKAKAPRSNPSAPPVPESKPQSEGVIKITPAPEAPKPAPSPAAIPDDI